MRVNHPEILINGEPSCLEQAPFLRNGTAYVPLREVTGLLGGIVKYLPWDRSILVIAPKTANKDKVSWGRIWIGSSRIFRYGEERPEFASKSTQAGVLLKEGKVYVPIDYFTALGFGEVMNVTNDRLTISNMKEDVISIGEIHLNVDFKQLPEETQARFQATGEAEATRDGSYQQAVYTDGDMDLILEQMVGQEAMPIRGIVLHNHKYATKRGLRVGDSEERFLDLYAGYNFGCSFQVKVTAGKVTNIRVNSFF